MKYLLFVMLVSGSLQNAAQESASPAPKAWLGVLTLADQYKNQQNWTPADQKVVESHFQRLVSMKEKGVVLMAGRTQLELDNPDMMGLVIFYKATEQEANAFMEEDPAVRNGIMRAKVFPYGVAVSKCQ